MLSLAWNRAIKCLAFAGLATVATANAEAGFTKVNAPPDAELSHRAILSYTYGGSFTAITGGMSFTNGAITATRLEDFGAGGTLDECWDGDILSARALGRWAGYEQKLGIVAGESGAGSFQELLSVAGNGINVTGSASVKKMSGQEFRFARGGGGELMTSMAADNRGAVDQMVSYRLDGLPGAGTTYLLGFEDLGPGANSDWDYNDLVVEVTTGNAVVAVPLPPAVWSGLAMLLSGGLWGARTRVRQWFA